MSLTLAKAEELSPPARLGEWAQQLREAAFNAVSEADVVSVMTKLKEKALAGDLGATKLLLMYLTGGGAPAVRVEKVVVRRGRKARPPRVIPAEPDPPRAVAVESLAAGQLRKLAAVYLLQHDSATGGELCRLLEVGEAEVEAVMNCEWFVKRNHEYRLASEGRRAVG